MKNAILAASLFASFATTIHLAHAEEGGKFSLETGMDYNTGKYGGTQSTDILYVPVIGKYQGKSWTLKLTVPYLRITGPANVINIMNGVSVTGGANTPLTRSGLGDVILGATHNAYTSGASGVMINLTGKVKFGTASSAKGLGTGKNDYALQADLYKTTGSLTNFGTFGYKIYGSPIGYTLNNVFYGSLGVSYKFKPETNGGLVLALGQKTMATGSTHIEMLFFVNHKLDKNWKAQGYMLKGFTNGVPDLGAGASIVYLF
ncbi:MAG: hypothetical protein ABI536_04305 [Gallionella sp.]